MQTNFKASLIIIIEFFITHIRSENYKFKIFFRNFKDSVDKFRVV
jgi:hypothetical protein